MNDDSERGGGGRCSSIASEASRLSLKRDLRRFRNSLTPQEANFLADLIVNGNEIEVQLAHSNLLKFDFEIPPPAQDDDWSSSEIIRVGGEQSLNLDDLDPSLSDEDGDNDNNNNNAKSVSRSGSNASNPSLGSDRRVEALETRRKNLLFGKIWKAHQSGLAVSRNSSRRSLVQRRASASGSGYANSNNGGSGSSTAASVRREMFLRQQGGDNIFRSRAPAARRLPMVGGSSRNLAMGDTRSDNFRRASMASTRDFRSVRHHVKSKSLIFDPVNTSADTSGSAGTGLTFPVPRRTKPVLRRLNSEGTRKSVTFGSLPGAGRIKSESSAAYSDSVYPIRENLKEPVQRRDSLSSIPSIHIAHPIRSPSMASVSSIPSLHLDHHIHGSQSFRSSGNASYCSALSSLDGGHPLERDGDDDSEADDEALVVDEKKSEEAAHRLQLLGELPPPKTTGAETALEPEDSLQNSFLREPDANDEKKDANAVTPLTKNFKRPILIRDASANKYDGIGIETMDSSSSDQKPIGRAKLGRPVLMRDASQNLYSEEGVEVADFESTASSAKQDIKDIPIQTARRLDSLVSFGGDGSMTENDNDSLWMLHRSDTFDETMSYGRVSSIFRRTIRRSLSDDDIMSGVFLGGSRLLLRETSSLREVCVEPDTDMDSWLMDDESELDYYDSWKVIEDEYENGYGGGGTLPFHILGTSADDVDAHPHVLSPPLMESLQAFLPPTKAGDSFWMKYSLVRDGASLYSFLQRSRGAKFSFLAIETTDGEVFGSFTTEPWRKNWNFFGGGSQSFLWRMRHSRREKCHSIIDQAQKESEIDVYPYAGENNFVQLCTHDKLAVGGGDVGTVETHDSEKKQDLPQLDSPVKDHEWGFGT